MKTVQSLALFFGLIVASLNAASWSPAVTMEARWSINPSIATDSKGNAIAVWVHFDEEQVWIKASTKTVDNEWSEPALLSEPVAREGFPTQVPVVKFDQYDNALALWPNVDGTKQVLEAAMLPAGKQSWIQIPPFVSTNNQIVDEVLFAFDTKDSILVVYKTKGDGGFQLESGRLKLRSQTWQAKKVIELSYYPNYLDMAVDAAGNAVMVWSEQKTDSSEYSPTAVVGTTLTKDATTWSKPQVIHEAPAVYISKLALDASGNSLVLFRKLDKDEKFWRIEGATLLSGSSNWNMTYVPQSSASSEYGPRLCRLVHDGKGKCLTVWQYDDGSPVKSATFSFTDMTWSEPLDVVASDNGIYYVNLAMDTLGNAVFIWEADPNSDKQYPLMASTLSSDQNSSWTAPVELATFHESEDRPQIALSQAGPCHVIFWTSPGYVPTYIVEAVSGTIL